MPLAMAGWNNPQQHGAPEQQAGRGSGGETGSPCYQAQVRAGLHIAGSDNSHNTFDQMLTFELLITFVLTLIRNVLCSGYWREGKQFEDRQAQVSFYQVAERQRQRQRQIQTQTQTHQLPLTNNHNNQSQMI